MIRVCAYLSKSSEKQTSFADFVNNSFKICFEELFNGLFKTVSVQARKYHLPFHEVVLEIANGLFSNIIALMHADIADKMRTNKISGAMEYKLFLLEIESYVFNVAQNPYLPQFLKQITEDRGT